MSHGGAVLALGKELMNGKYILYQFFFSGVIWHSFLDFSAVVLIYTS